MSTNCKRCSAPADCDFCSTCEAFQIPQEDTSWMSKEYHASPRVPGQYAIFKKKNGRITPVAPAPRTTIKMRLQPTGK